MIAFVGFCDWPQGNRPLACALLRPGYRHCFVMQYLPETGQWLVIDPSWRRISIHMVSGERIDALAAMCWAGGGCVLRIKTGRLPQHPRVWWNGCCAVVASLIGHRSALSPWRLAQRLRATGATEVFHGQPGEGTAAEKRPCRRAPARTRRTARA